MVERREEQLRDCILGMFNLSVQTGKRIFLRQTFVKLSLMRHQKLTYTIFIKQKYVVYTYKERFISDTTVYSHSIVLIARGSAK